MSKIEWDKTGERFYEIGVDHGVLYPQKSDGTYNTGVAWNGLTTVTASPGGAEPTDLWADNIKYASIRSAETFGGTIEAYYYPPEFGECDGTKSPLKGVRVGQQSRAPFGFSYRTLVQNDTATEADDSYIIHLIYNATASPSEQAHSTVNDSPDATPFSWEFDTTPVNVGIPGFKPCATIDIDSRDFTEDGAEKLAALEKLLYGDTDTEPSLPDPLTVLTTLGYVKQMSAPSSNRVVATTTKNAVEIK